MLVGQSKIRSLSSRYDKCFQNLRQKCSFLTAGINILIFNSSSTHLTSKNNNHAILYVKLKLSLYRQFITKPQRRIVLNERLFNDIVQALLSPSSFPSKIFFQYTFWNLLINDTTHISQVFEFNFNFDFYLQFNTTIISFFLSQEYFLLFIYITSYILSSSFSWHGICI